MTNVPVVCHSSEFKCPNEEKCIALSSACDGNRDCWDGADEAPEQCDAPEVANEGHSSKLDDIEFSGDHGGECRESELIDKYAQILIHLLQPMEMVILLR